jgi:hypothetical protein
MFTAKMSDSSRWTPGSNGDPTDPTDLVALSELAAEGFGWDNVRTPRDAIDVLAAQLNGEVVLDDLGRRCVTRETARRLFTDRAALEVRQQEARERQDAAFAEQSAANRPWTGVPARSDWDGVSAASVMLASVKDAQPRRQSVLQHALADRDGAAEYHPIEQP